MRHDRQPCGRAVQRWHRRLKDSLDIFIDSAAEEYRAANRADEIAALVERLRAVAPDYIVVEASGGFESGVVAALATAGLAVCRVSPQRVRSFARALGELAKTDRLDARLLARYGRDSARRCRA